MMNLTGTLVNFAVTFWNLVIESAPWLLLGYLLAGIIKQVIPAEWVRGQLSRPGILPIVKGAFIGAPLPLCSCGVIPAALAIRKAGASKGATSSFLVATPETGVDSISFSYVMLGPVFALARPVAALLSAIVTGLLVNALDGEEARVSSGAAPGSPASAGCCRKDASSAPMPDVAVPPPLRKRLIAAVQYGYGRMISDTARWLALGLAAAAVITTLVPQSFLLQWGDGLPAMLVMVVAGLPMYICATASTPVAASLLFAGVSPGAALVFMLTGPATNIATMGVIRQHLGGRSLAAYLLGVIGSAILCGLLLNQLAAAFAWPLRALSPEHGAGWPLWRQFAALLLTALVLRIWIQPRLGTLGEWYRRRIRQAVPRAANALGEVAENPGKPFPP